MNTNVSTIDEVKQLIVQTLGIEDPSRIAGASTQLFGNLPELDSFAVVNLAMEIESRFGFEIDESGFSADVFETVGSLASYIDQNRRH